jgi:hypothetical protein
MEYLRWSDHPIKFSRADHQGKFPGRATRQWC